MLVEIVEPHMYDVDDAVAKIDGYIISIAGASPYVGEKRMVRIDQVGRTAASALLLDESGEVVLAPVRASSTRTGARGGRRAPARSAASAGASRNGGSGGASRNGDASGSDDDAAEASEQLQRRGRRRRSPIDSEDAEVRREAGLGDAPAGIDSEPEEEAAVVVLAGVDAPEGDSAEDGLQSKPRRRGRRGGRRRSAAKAKATPE